MSELQDALIPLAEKAKAGTVGMCHEERIRGVSCVLVVCDNEGRIEYPLPGADGTLSDAEVTVVLGWLAKADIFLSYDHDSFGSYTWDDWQTKADTLNAALAAAVLALHEASHAL